MRPGSVDAVVLTALDLEYAAVRDHLTGPRTYTDANGTRYETGQSRGGCRVALALTGPGNLAAAALATRAVAWFRPKVLVLVGVAGGLDREVALGDVVVATRVHAYHGGRADSRGFRPRPKSWPLAHGLEQDARDVARNGAWTRLLPRDAGPPVVHFKPLVSGEVVLDGRDGVIARLIDEHYSDAVAIDMESAGVAEAAHHNDFHQTVVVRAVSDRADGSKSDTDATGWQPRAAVHAAAFAVALVERVAAGAPILAGYRGHVEAIAPEKLLDREGELAELARFAGGGVSYAWWQAGPWAGKSALMSWFVLHPPEGVDVVSFFVTGRLAAQEDSDAFTKELTRQLGALTGEHPSDALSADERQDQLWRLLDEAGARTRPLLVVIDGLDEDAGPAHGKPSIASLLPRQLPPNVRILVASRPDPRVPDDVLDEDHPLLTCARRELETSPHARSRQRRAVNELNQHLRGDDLHRDLLGLITASGGGLSRGDLEELTGRPPYELDRLLAGPLGRTIGSRPAPLRPDESKPVHLFAHETLAATAQAKFGASVRTYRDRLHGWADGYREKGWPPDTPQYLLVGYPHVLADADVDRLVAVATDRARHDRMLRTSGGDALAANEVRLAQDLVCRTPAPDLSALLLLAAHRDGLADRNSGIPVRLPLVWMMLGDVARAEALARGIADRKSRARSLVVLAGFAAGTGDRDRCDTLVAEVRVLVGELLESFERDEVLAELAVVVGDDDETPPEPAPDVATVSEAVQRARAAIAAVKTAGAEPLPDLLAQAVDIVRDLSGWDLFESTGRLAEAAASVGDQDRAHALLVDAGRLAHRVDEASLRDRLVRRLLLPSAFAAGEYDWALARINEFTDRDELVRATAMLADAVGSAGGDRALSLLDDAAALARGMHDTDAAERACVWVAVAAARIGEHDRAQALMRDVSGGWLRDQALVDLAKAAIGDLERALPLVRGIEDEDRQTQALADLAETAAVAGEHDQALYLVDLVRDVNVHRNTVETLAVLAAKAGVYERARALASSITHPFRRTDVRRKLVSTAVAGGDWDQALAVVDDMADDSTKRDSLSELVVAIAAAGDPDRARDVAIRITSRRYLPEVLIRLAQAAAEAGDPSRALELLTEATTVDARHGPLIRSHVLASAVEVAVAAGRRDQALAFTRDIVNPHSQVRAFTLLAEATAEAGDHDTARDLAVKVETIARNDLNAAGPIAVTGLAVASLLVGDHDRASRLIRGILDGEWRVWALEELARAAPEPTRALLTDTIAATATIQDVAARAALLIGLVGAAGTVDQPDLLRLLVADTEATIAAVDRVEARAYLLAFLSQATAVAGQVDAARSLLAVAESLAVPDGLVFPRYDIAPTLGPGLDTTLEHELATAAVEVGDLERAQAHAGRITDSGERHTVLTRLALAASRAGDRELTMTAVRGIGSSMDRHEALAKLMRQATAAGDHELARSFAVATTSTYHLTEMLTWLARFATVTGDQQRAQTLATPDSYRRSEHAESIVDILIATGDGATAAAVARDHAYGPDIEPSLTLVPALTKLVDAEIAAGEHDRALTAAREITEPGPRLKALARVVEAAAAAGDGVLARSLLAEVLVLDRWYESVKLVARAAPDALTPVLDELESRCAVLS